MSNYHQLNLVRNEANCTVVLSYENWINGKDLVLEINRWNQIFRIDWNDDTETWEEISVNIYDELVKLLDRLEESDV